MNIGIVTQWFPSGAGHVSKSYVEALKERHKVFIYARGGAILKGNSEWDSDNVTWAPNHSCITGIHRKHFVKWVKKNKIETVLFNEQKHWDAVVLSKKIGLLTGSYIDYYTQDTVPYFDLYDFLICNTLRHYSVFKHHPQCLYIPWGTKVPESRMQRSKHDPINFIISSGWDGKYSKYKPYMDRRGAGISFRAFKAVKGNARLIVYSQVKLSECPEDWQKYVMGDDRIDFREGTFSPFPYVEGDVYLYPSRLDGIGLTLPEALSYGLAAITTNNPPMNEFVANGENGTLVPVKNYLSRPDGYYWPECICDENELALAMQSYVDTPGLYEKHGQCAYEIAKENLSWERNSANLSFWIESVKPIGSRNATLLSQTRKYDREHNPTVLDRILMAFYFIKIRFDKKSFWSLK